MHDLRVGSLFSGIGGIELGLERAGGFQTEWFVEWDAYAQAVLRKNWPGVPVYGDVREIDWGAVAPVDVLAGGFPCQPHSVAGKRQASKDERDLWPECVRAIEALKPKACCFENVPGLLTSEKGAFFKRIIDDFYRLGYRPRVYRLSARDVGAPHLRKRVFIVAYPDVGQREQPDEALRAGRDALNRCRAEVADSSIARGGGLYARSRKEGERAIDAFGSREDVADAESWKDERRERGFLAQEAEGREGGDPAPDVGRADVSDADGDGGASGVSGSIAGEEGQSGIAFDACSQGRGENWNAGPDGWWAVEPDVGRVAYGVPSRVDRLKCLGNAVVPQCAQVIAEIIKQDIARGAE